jgi:hypothetical protein
MEGVVKMNVYKKVKNYGPYHATIIKPINMGHKDASDILSFVDERFLQIDEGGQVLIKEGQQVEVRYVRSNGCLELRFPDLISSCDIIFDDDDEADLYLKLV